ncbi:helix-turn-helix domain-containing protein [Peribacillus psychrosaccharolyticus]|uniref:Helix-turn-helix domain-containing protein n=1 Tax=Peribacillus psychrosaccharolyticus TaxID=1407 RepID=A0A974NPM2_PERPY|nr:RodZ domain-containing protein [Peribacillus psychrosaccharolyticus]MEC2053875.1 DUF4115 domain-containing protein [Peribacillus psychrosaccharolyticus]MED3742511.1 DUF4115 domain-containing protein [Peribacillus psychrosaccharolyticus]QQT01463.1 helix-turn-helix domain-containing protein [Peribacillus psychrosaccharolyticus]
MTELGNRLKEARTARGMTLDDLQEVTKIQKRYLVGIEEGNYDMMPGKFYVRAFIKQYCEAVGLDSEEIFEQYKSEVPAIANQELPDQLSRVRTRKSLSPSTSKFMEIFPKILVSIFVLGAIILVYVLWVNYNNDNKSSGSPEVKNEDNVNYGETKNSPLEKDKEKEETKEPEEKTTEPADEESKGTEEEPELEQELASVSNAGTNSTYELKNTDKFLLKLSSKGETWVSVKNANGKSLFEGILKDSESKEIDFSEETEAKVRIGNAAATEIYVNEELLEYSVSPTKSTTQTVTIQFTKPE